MRTGWVIWCLLLIGGGFTIYEWKFAADDDVELPKMPSSTILQADSAPLELKLKQGDRFPLLKTVRQELSQFTPQGLITNRSELRILLAITVEQVSTKGKLLNVRYETVKYSQNMAGEKVEYDSNAAPQRVPDSLRAYAGLLDNGFSFWIDPTNQLIEVVDFDDFLRNCVRSVPPEQKQAVLHQLIASSGEEDIANFIDDSIGLLPFDSDQGTAVAVGDTWIRERQIVRPLPIFVSTKYTLTQLEQKQAEINISGDVTPSNTFGPSDQESSDVVLTVLGGRTFGTCTIDRETGFPVHSRIERNLNMHVKAAGGVEFNQHKLTVTTIKMFPQTTAAVQLQGSNVIQAGFEETADSPKQ